MSHHAQHEAESATQEEPQSRWLDFTPDMSLAEAFDSISTLQTKPPGREDVDLFTKETLDHFLAFLDSKLPVVKTKLESKLSLRARTELTDDEIKAIVAYTCDKPHPRIYLVVNAVMMQSRGMAQHTAKVGPFIRLLITALNKLDKVRHMQAARAVRIGNHPALLHAFRNHSSVLCPGAAVNFWGFSSWTLSDRVMADPAFSGSPAEKAIIYKAADMEGVDLSPFSLAPSDEMEVMPLPPARFEVQLTCEVPNVPKLVVVVKQKDNSEHLYMTVACRAPSAAPTPTKVASSSSSSSEQHKKPTSKAQGQQQQQQQPGSLLQPHEVLAVFDFAAQGQHPTQHSPTQQQQQQQQQHNNPVASVPMPSLPGPLIHNSSGKQQHQHGGVAPQQQQRHYPHQQQQQQQQQQGWQNPFPRRTRCHRCKKRRTMADVLLCQPCGEELFKTRLLPILRQVGPHGALRFSNEKNAPFFELSNGYPVQLRDPNNEPGRRYSSLESMYHCAKFSAHTAIAEQIRLAPSARDAYDLSRQYHGRERQDWDQRHEDVMLFLLNLKFTTNRHCHNVLRSTGETVLVFECQHDSFWGNGGNDSGQNKLGFALMKVRHDIVSQNKTVPPSSDDDEAEAAAVSSSLPHAASAPNILVSSTAPPLPAGAPQPSSNAWFQQPQQQQQQQPPHSQSAFTVVPAQQQQPQQTAQPSHHPHQPHHHAPLPSQPGARHCANANCQCDVTDGRFPYCCRSCAAGRACTSRVHVATAQQVAAYPTTAVTASSSTTASSAPAPQDCARSGCPCHASDPSQGHVYCSKACAAGRPCNGPWHRKS